MMNLILIPILLAFITAVVGPVAVEWVKLKFIKPKDTLKEAINHNELIDVQLESIVDELNCDRIWIAQFHNGGHFYPTGKSIQKFSIFYERLTPNATSLIEYFQNIPVSLFPKLLSKLHSDGELLIEDYDEEKQNYGLFTLAKDPNTKSFYIFTIKDLNDQFVAVLGMSFINEQHILNNTDKTFIQNKLGVLGTVLNDYLHSSKK